MYSAAPRSVMLLTPSVDMVSPISESREFGKFQYNRLIPNGQEELQYSLKALAKGGTRDKIRMLIDRLDGGLFMSIGSAIREYRKEKGWNLERLAEEVGVHQVTVSRYELGKREVSEEKLSQIANALEVSVEDIRERAKQINERSADQGALPPGFVQQKSDISDWRDEVIQDSKLNHWVQMILMALPAFLDRDHWVIAITEEHFIEETGRSEEVVDEHWEEVLESDYVERVGVNEWTLRLTFPED